MRESQFVEHRAKRVDSLCLKRINNITSTVCEGKAKGDNNSRKNGSRQEVRSKTRERDIISESLSGLVKHQLVEIPNGNDNCKGSNEKVRLVE